MIRVMVLKDGVPRNTDGAGDLDGGPWKKKGITGSTVMPCTIVQIER